MIRWERIQFIWPVSLLSQSVTYSILVALVFGFYFLFWFCCCYYVCLLVCLFLWLSPRRLSVEFLVILLLLHVSLHHLASVQTRTLLIDGGCGWEESFLKTRNVSSLEQFVFFIKEFCLILAPSSFTIYTH